MQGPHRFQAMLSTSVGVRPTVNNVNDTSSAGLYPPLRIRGTEEEDACHREHALLNVHFPVGIINFTFLIKKEHQLIHFAGTHCRECGFIPPFHWHLLSTDYVPDSAGSWHLEGYCG